MSRTGPVNLAYRYATPSALVRDELSLATSGGITEAGPAVHPYFFTGFLAEPGPAAQALLATAAIARTQYHVAASTIRMLRDPVVTSNADRLRFESFSACCGVHARLDLPPEALGAAPVTSGTTNVDFNPPMRAALAGAVATASQILLKVGDQGVTAVTEQASVTERKVELPARWVKGFGEVSALHARIGEACTLIAAGRALPLLAEPEFADGTISPGELTARLALWAAAEFTPCRYDLEAARLRAAPGADEELALEPFVTLPRVGYHAMRWGRERFTEGSTGVHARMARVPASASAPYCWPLLTHLAHSLDDRRFAVGRSGVRLDEMIAAWHLLCPHDPELIAAHLLSPLSDGLGPGRNAAVTAVRGLASLAGAFGKICHLALVTGLSGASADVRIAAADAWTQIAGEGRLDPALAAEAIELGVTGGALKLSRIADGLGHAAPDPVASAGVAQTCLTATAALLSAKPAGLHLLLELAAQVSTVSGMPELPAPVAALARRKGTSKLAEAARRLTRLG